MFKAAHATTNGGLWFCAVLRDGHQFCHVLNQHTEQAALDRAEMIADALNRAAA
jgi:hypothetical protein